MTERPYISYSKQCIDEDDIAEVVRVLHSDWLTQGPSIEQFENAVKLQCGAPHAVAVSSATAGLHLACMALGVGQGDLVWTSPISFVASANCARYVGATIDFVDIDPATGNMSMQALAEQLHKAKSDGTLPKVVIPVHYAGRSCDMQHLKELKVEYGFHVIEDAAHAQGAAYADGRPVGSNTDSELTVFSFHPVKPVTTGEGGVIVTHNATLAERLRLLRSHGITRDPKRLQDTHQPAWYYEQQDLGYHYRLTDIQAALGFSQMKKLEKFITMRRSIAARYHTLLANTEITLPPTDKNCGWHLYVVQLPEEKRDAIFTQLRNANIGVNLHYWPIHLQPYYRSLGFKDGLFPHAEHFARCALSLPIHPHISEVDLVYVTHTVATALNDSLTQ